MADKCFIGLILEESVDFLESLRRIVGAGLRCRYSEVGKEGEALGLHSGCLIGVVTSCALLCFASL